MFFEAQCIKYQIIVINNISKIMMMINNIRSIRKMMSTFKRKHFKQLQPADINYFKGILSQRNCIEGSSNIESFNSDWRGNFKGNSSLVLLPNSTQQLSQILSYCNSNNLGVCPQSGNTGLVGGSVPVFDEVIINMKQFNKIEGYDNVSGVLSCEAGCILEKLNQHLESYGVQIPLDLGAKGSCMIGGNAATNAGGKYVIKHGSFRSHILGLEVVLANGTILNMRSKIHKDNTGYNLKDLFIGCEGTLGIITKLDISCAKIDYNKKILVLKTDNYQSILNSLPIIKNTTGKGLNALQYVDGYAYQIVIKNLYPSIIDMGINDHLLFVQLTNSVQQIQQLIGKLPQFKDSLLSNNDKEYNSIWKIREDVAPAAKMEGSIVSAYDVSFDVRYWQQLLKMIRDKSGSLVVGYGHIGDGNLHINICQGEKKQFDKTQIFKYIVSKQGSISAQHGIGLQKPNYLSLQKSPQIISIYKGLKEMFDPKGILNPYKVLP